ncbi:MAG: hypothetical protein K2V38_04360, partial [Gemmataceae bacterium]|nr:hypothetical protein [Gemmataceae bacterium]
LRTRGLELPPGYHMSSLQINAAAAAAGFVGPGSRVNVLATVRLGTRVESFPLLVNMLVVAVDTQTSYTKENGTGTFPTLNTVSFAVKQKEALLLSLAKNRGCSLELLLLSNNTDANEMAKDYRIDDVIKKLQEDKEVSKVSGVSGNDGERPPQGTEPKVEPKTTEPKVEQKNPEPAPQPTVAMVKVKIAKRDVAANTEVTEDLLANDFEEKMVPKELAGNVLGDPTEALGKFLQDKLYKGQWISPGIVGLQKSKSEPPEVFPLPPSAEPKKDGPKPVADKPVYHDVTIHTASGTVVHRYQLIDGKWKKIAELTPEQAARPTDEAPRAPKPEAEKKIDGTL